MELMANIDIKKLQTPIQYGQKILLIGSCFTEHIGNALADAKLTVLQNPNGILFDVMSVCKNLLSYIDQKHYNQQDLFQLNEVWNSWDHHSRFSNIDKEQALLGINKSQTEAHNYLKNADWLIITLGSSFSYRLNNGQQTSSTATGMGVANCHRAPAQWFQKHLLEINEIVENLDNCFHRLKIFNSKLKIIFTVSPVRHLRDGVVENNRSKARLIESVHHMVNKFEGLYYFPAYELVIDVLRDYRFYDVDLAHPNYLATNFVLEKFIETCIDSASQQLMDEVKKIVIARKHKAFQPTSNAHKQFLQFNASAIKALIGKYPFLNFEEELKYFEATT